MQNNNQNEDNLFTQMFGLPSELPDNKSVSNQKPLPEQPQVIEQPQVVEQPKVENPIPENKPSIENPLSSLNALVETPATETQKPIENNQTITLTSNKKQDEEVFLSSNITSEQQAKKEIELSNSQEEPVQNTFAPSTPINNNFTELNPMSINNTYYQEVPTTYETSKKGFNSMPIVTILIILIIGGLAVGGTYIYKTYLQPSNNSNINNIPNDEEQENEEQPDIIIEPETEEEVKKVINFTEDLSFNKGYTTNQNELKQKSPFKPTETTGVILCETLTTIKSTTEDVNQKLYFYYEENLLKKIIVHNHRNIKDNKTYQDVKASGKIIHDKFANQEGFRFTLKEYPGTKKVDTIMYMNLAYGNKVAFTEQKFYFELAYDYNDKIDTTLAALLYEEATLGKLACSSLITE